MQLLNDIATMIEDIWIKRVHLQRLIRPFIDSRPTNRQLQYLFFELDIRTPSPSNDLTYWIMIHKNGQECSRLGKAKQLPHQQTKTNLLYHWCSSRVSWISWTQISDQNPGPTVWDWSAFQAFRTSKTRPGKAWKTNSQKITCSTWEDMQKGESALRLKDTQKRPS